MNRGYEYQSEWALRHRAEGRAEGEAEGKAEILLKLLTLKFGGVSAEQLAQVQSSSVDELERYAERVITVDMLDEVLASRAREERRELQEGRPGALGQDLQRIEDDTWNRHVRTSGGKLSPQPDKDDTWHRHIRTSGGKLSPQPDDDDTWHRHVRTSGGKLSS